MLEGLLSEALGTALVLAFQLPDSLSASAPNRSSATLCTLPAQSPFPVAKPSGSTLLNSFV